MNMKHILLVDDVLTNLKCESLILKDKYKVTTARSGREALEYLENVVPDLVLLDIIMKDMDGYEVMKHMKKNPETSQIPVILLTADTERENEEKALAMGAIDFIRKPVDSKMLLGRIEAVWNMEEQTEWEWVE